MIKEFFEVLLTLRPVDLSVVMLAFTLFDTWTALILSIRKGSTLSKRFINGLFANIVAILTPFIIDGLVHHIPGQAPAFNYSQVLSLVVAVLYCVATAASIIANYTAANPEAENWITRFALKHLPAEIQSKLDKHNK